MAVRNVLFVTENKIRAKLIWEHLKQQGSLVEVRYTTEKLAEEIESSAKKPELILYDEEVGHKALSALLKALKAQGTLTQMKVVLLTPEMDDKEKKHLEEKLGVYIFVQIDHSLADLSAYILTLFTQKPAE